MNIFMTDLDPYLSAIALPDKLCVKMTLETTQIASTVQHIHGTPEDILREAGVITTMGTVYRPTHPKHPSVLWAASSRDAYDWAVRHGLFIAKEYTYRFGRTHACHSVLWGLSSLRDRIPDARMLPVPMAMPDEYKRDDPTEAYRIYMNEAKRYYAKWTRRPPPDWWVSFDEIDEAVKEVMA